MQDAHHLVILVRKDVTVPDVAAWLVELGLDRGSKGFRLSKLMRKAADRNGQSS